MKLLGLSFLLLITPSLSFVAPSVYTRSATDGSASILSTASVSSDQSTVDPFVSYQLGQTSLAYKDEAIGQGESAQNGDVLKVSFVGRLHPSRQQFAKNEDFVFELGEGKTLPGFDLALGGTQAGTRRIIRVPPSLAYGKRGNAVSTAPVECSLLRTTKSAVLIDL
jgi:FKBP-type peptidyl-prolyl cis-trans isomerase